MLIVAKNLLEISWRKMASRLDVGYTTLRDWRDEKYSMSYESFHKIAELCPQCKHFEDFVINLKEDNWGQLLGGFGAKK